MEKKERKETEAMEKKIIISLRNLTRRTGTRVSLDPDVIPIDAVVEVRTRRRLRDDSRCGSRSERPSRSLFALKSEQNGDEYQLQYQYDDGGKNALFHVVSIFQNIHPQVIFDESGVFGEAFCSS